MLDRKQTGYYGERVAAKALMDLGYTILEQNYTIRGGELDLVAQKNREMVFVEVKTRRNDAFGTPLESITPKKRRRMLHAAKMYLGGRDNGDIDIRFFAVAVYLNGADTVLRTEIYEDIFV